MFLFSEAFLRHSHDSIKHVKFLSLNLSDLSIIFYLNSLVTVLKTLNFFERNYRGNYKIWENTVNTERKGFYLWAFSSIFFVLFLLLSSFCNCIFAQTISVHSENSVQKHEKEWSLVISKYPKREGLKYYLWSLYITIFLILPCFFEVLLWSLMKHYLQIVLGSQK